MNKEALLKFHKPLRIILSAAILLTGLCLITACLGIFLSGIQPFSRESVAAAFRSIAIPLFLGLGISVICILAELLLPRSEEAQTPGRHLPMLLKRAQNRTDLSLCDAELRSEILALRSTRKLYHCTGMVILALSTVLFFTYGLNLRNYHPTYIDQTMIRALYWLVPCTVVPFVYGLFAAGKNRISMAKELALLKSAPKGSRIPVPRHSGHEKRDFVLRVGFLMLGLGFLIWGIFTGGARDVLTKAANICSECIGLG